MVCLIIAYWIFLKRYEIKNFIIYIVKKKKVKIVENLTFLHFTSAVDFNLNINGEYVKTSSTHENRFVTVATTKKAIYFTYLPISTTKTYLPFTQKLELNKDGINSQSQYVEVIPFKNNHYEIFLTPPLSATNTLSEIINEEYFGKTNVVLLNNNTGNIFVYDNNKLKKQFVTSIIKNAELNQKNNNIIIKCELEEDKYFLVILKADTIETILEVECDTIEENETQIKALKKMLDLSKHAFVNTFSFETNKVETYKVFLNNQPNKTTDKYLIPLAFLEAVKYENFNLAKSYLASDLAEAPDNFFAGYFGNIKNIYFDRYNLNKPNVGYTIKANEIFSYFEFAIENGMITEITKV